MKTLDSIMLNRRQMMALGLGATAVFGLAACGGSSDSSTSESAEASQSEETELKDEQEAPAVDAKAFDELLSTGPVASDDQIAASAWASKIKEAGKLRVGGVETSTFFSLKDFEDGHYRGFDAGLFQLLARYITGDEAKFALTKVTSDTRESVLQNGDVDSVFATYTVTPDRAKLIDFAGPYYTTQQAILVAKDNDDIKSLDDLSGKNVAVQSGSTGPAIVASLVPDAVQQLFTTDEEARLALEQKRVDAYVIDYNMQMGAVARNPSKYKIVGEPFGYNDDYGIGLPEGDKDAVAFVNDFVKAIEDAGIWADLWKISIGDRIGADEVPTAPSLGVFHNPKTGEVFTEE